LVHSFRVAIAGAGLAGLSAAYELAGALVTLLDARPYAGGRVRTIREFAWKQPGELGGEFIETEHREILDLCRGFDLLLCRFCVVRLRTDSAGRTAYHVSRTAP
jgi:monoamine oxidase